MDNGYSLADLATATGNGFGGGNEFIWIFALLILFGGGGFGWNRQGDFGQFATSASQSEILLGQKFDNTNNLIQQVANGICSLGYDQLRQMDANTASINGNVTAEGRAIQTQLCALNSNIDNKFAQLEKAQLEQTIQAQANQINQLALAQQMTGVVRYPMTSSYCSGANPFCGCGCGCAN